MHHERLKVMVRQTELQYHFMNRGGVLGLGGVSLLAHCQTGFSQVL